MLETSVLIINSEKSESRTIELLQILKDTPAVIFGVLMQMMNSE